MGSHDDRGYGAGLLVIKLIIIILVSLRLASLHRVSEVQVVAVESDGLVVHLVRH